MRKYLLPLLGALLVLILSCTPPVSLETPKVDWTVKDNGGTLGLTWQSITDAEGFKIYYDGSTTPDTTLGSSATSLDVTAPHKTIKVEVYSGSDAMDSTLNVSAASTVTTLDLHGISVPGADNAFGFNTTTGMAMAVDLSAQANWPDADFIMEDRPPDAMSFWAPTEYSPVYNDKENASAQAAGITDFDALDVAAAPGNYTTKTEISQNAVYSLWIDPTANGYSTDDHFGKAQVTSLSGAAVTLKLAYQKIPGLRWFVTQ